MITAVAMIVASVAAEQQEYKHPETYEQLRDRTLAERRLEKEKKAEQVRYLRYRRSLYKKHVKAKQSARVRYAVNALRRTRSPCLYSPAQMRRARITIATGGKR